MDYNDVRLVVFIFLKKWAQNIVVGLMEKMALSMQAVSISQGTTTHTCETTRIYSNPSTQP